MKLNRVMALTGLATLLMACNLLTPSRTSEPTPLPTEPTRPTATAAEPSPTPPPPELTLAQLRQLEINAPVYERAAQLTDGVYQAGEGAEAFYAGLLDLMAFGDLNGDGLADAAVLLAENGGGSGTFVSVIVFLNQNGQPAQAGSAMIDDRPAVHSLTIEDGLIVIDATIHGIQDSMAEPTLGVNEVYQLSSSSRLTLRRLTSHPAEGVERSIQIDQPREGGSASGAVRVTGSMPVAPFENNLVYGFYDTMGTMLQSGSFMVSAEEMGGPATFEETLSLPPVERGARLLLELAEESMADGTYLTMNSVELVIE